MACEPGCVVDTPNAPPLDVSVSAAQLESSSRFPEGARIRDLATAWAVLAAVECFLATRGYLPVLAWQYAFELFGLGILCISQIRLLPVGWPQSPLWPGMFALVMTLGWAQPFGVYGTTGVIAGLVVAAAGLAMALERVANARIRLAVGILCSVIGMIGARYVVLVEGASVGPGSNAWRIALGDLAEELAPEFPRSQSFHDAPPVLVITVDTLRWDSMREMTSFSRLAARGLSWQRAMSTSSWTLPAMASMQTGLPVSGHGASARPGGSTQGIDPEVAVLPEQLHAAGYETWAVLTNAWLTGAHGFDRGFDHFEQSLHPPGRMLLTGFPNKDSHDSAVHTTDLAIRAIESLDARGSYLWVHYIDVHMPWEHAGGWVAGAITLPDSRPYSAAERSEARAAYEQEVDFVDAQIGRLLDAAEAKGWLDQGVVVFTSDHGEELWDHGSTGHGHSHHGEVVDVGLVLLAPGVEPAAGSGTASLRDIAPTILAAVGLAAEGIDLRDGVPLGTIRSAWGNNRVGVESSARDERWRAIVGTDCRLRAYDLETDPLELQPVAMPLDHRVAAAAIAVPAPRLAGKAAEVVGQLVALGYLVEGDDGSGERKTCDRVLPAQPLPPGRREGAGGR